MMALKIIRLELARSAENPEGNRAHGYEFHAPLTSDGHLDPEEFRQAAQRCTVRHFRPGADEEHGQLIRIRGGGWAFSYAEGEDDDEPIFRLSTHIFKSGEYVTITEHDRAERTFRIASVHDASSSARSG